MNKMVFVLNKSKILKEDKVNLVKLCTYLDDVLISNNFEKESNDDTGLVYCSVKEEGCFEDLLRIYMLLFKEPWLKDCLLDWYLLSDEESEDGSLKRQEILSNKFARW